MLSAGCNDEPPQIKRRNIIFDRHYTATFKQVIDAL